MIREQIKKKDNYYFFYGILVFHSREHLILYEKISRNALLKKKNVNHCACKKHPIKTKQKQTKIWAHIFRKSSNIVERFPMAYCNVIAHVQTFTEVDRRVTAQYS